MLEADTQRHVCFVVERESVSRIAVWTEYRFKGELRHHLIVLHATHMLFPREKIGLQPECDTYDVPLSHAPTWLRDQGYRILAETKETPC